MILGYVLTPITGVVTYFATRKKQKNDFLKDQQSSISLLSEENKKLVVLVGELRNEVLESTKIILELRKENLGLCMEFSELKKELEKLKSTNK